MIPAGPRILIIRPSALGDVCRSVPVLVSLRRAFPDSTIDWLVQDTFASAVRFHPALSGVLPFPRRELGKQARAGQFAQVLAWLGQLRERRYDLVFDIQGLARSGVFAWWTRARRRVGYANARELGWLGYTERYRVPTTLHAVDRMLELGKLAGVEPVRDLRLYTDPADRRAVYDDPELSGRRYVVVAPTSRWPGKRWPPDRFASLCPRLLDLGADRVVLVGGAGERDQCAPLIELARHEPRILDRIGATSVGGLMALIESAALVVANDSAAVHMAVGFDRPIVALYGPTRNGLVGPYRRQADVIQHVQPGEPMNHKDESHGQEIMRRITADEAAARAAERLSAKPRATQPVV